MDSTIRFAEPADFQLVRAFDPHSKYIDPVRIQHKLAVQEIILAFLGDKPVGILKLCYFWATRPYIDLIWVANEYRKQGIGTKMLLFLEKFLITTGNTYLMTSSQDNEPEPQAWHKHHGFKVIGKLSDINLPHDSTNEVFFIKRIATGTPELDTLKEYPIV